MFAARRLIRCQTQKLSFLILIILLVVLIVLIVAVAAGAIKLTKGDFVYKKDSSEDYCYYIAKGTVQLTGKNYVGILERGDLFGEEACIIGEPHNLDAVAYTDCEIIRIDGKDFRSLLEKNPLASNKALSKVSTYFSKAFKQKQS